VHTLELVAPESESETESETERGKVRAGEKKLSPGSQTPQVRVRIVSLFLGGQIARICPQPVDKTNPENKFPSAQETASTSTVISFGPSTKVNAGKHYKKQRGV
jgi:hypothetical protein